MRNKEKIWCIPSADRISIFFSIHFENSIDKTICKLILNELEEAKRHVHNAPSIQKMLDGAVPDLLKKEFPNSDAIHQKTSNGIVCFSNLQSYIPFNYLALFECHYKNMEKAATLISGFRQYLHYHTHSAKSYLHGRVRKRVYKMLR